MLPCILRTQSRAISVARPVLIKNGLTRDCSKTLNQPLFKESSKAVTTRKFSTTSSIASKEKGIKCNKIILVVYICISDMISASKFHNVSEV